MVTCRENNFSDVVKIHQCRFFDRGRKINSKLDELNKAYDTVAAGARRIIFGRNIFMSKNPYTQVKALNLVIIEGLSSKETFVKYIKQAL